MAHTIDSIYQEFKNLIQSVENKYHLDVIRVKFLGKKGLVTKEAKKISTIPQKDRKEFGSRINAIKDSILLNISNLQKKFESNDIQRKLSKESIDITLPGRDFRHGKIHPISYAINIIRNIFHAAGFEYADGPDIENEWNNFTALNIPEDHPARRMHDTFYINSDYDKQLTKNRNLLRTHTSTIQIRHMLKYKPPLKVYSIGKAYRSDYDSTHTPMFHQLECIVIDKKSNIVDMQKCLKMFLRSFFDTNKIPMRFRSSYFPFTEPSFEVDIKYDKSNKTNIALDSKNSWLEVLGCGMVNSKVLKNANIDTNEYQGFAFGAGIERLTMLKYNIVDVRYFFENNLKWLNHYGF